MIKNLKNLKINLIFFFDSCYYITKFCQINYWAATLLFAQLIGSCTDVKKNEKIRSANKTFSGHEISRQHYRTKLIH